MTLHERVSRDLATHVPSEIGGAARQLGLEANAAAVLFYGSVLRTGKLDDILDFYVLVDRPTGSWLRRAASSVLWPDVTFRELQVGDRIIRAKVATMPLSTFERAASGGSIDTTIWTRFCQRSALVWSRGADEARRTTDAVAAAIVTAARFAAVVGPQAGNGRDFWLGLFGQTYRTEFRVENGGGRSAQVVDHDAERYEALLPLAWRAGDVKFDETAEGYRPDITSRARKALSRAWRMRSWLGKPLNIARLVKAAFTFQGATRYALWKIERHTGVRIETTPWRERHPVLAAPGVLWQVFRAQPQ
jgi:hypothetical protein